MINRNEIYFDRQFKRSNSILLDGSWLFSFAGQNIYKKEITVPFCPESDLSGIGYKGFIKNCLYERDFSISEDDLTGKLLLVFEAVDWQATVYVNDKFVGIHRGGYSKFKIDITSALVVGVNHLRVEVFDDVENHQASGKQSTLPYSHGCFYTRTTGIYKDVYIERVPSSYVINFKIVPDIYAVAATIDFDVVGEADLTLVASFDGKEVGRTNVNNFSGGKVELKLSEKHLWKVGEGNLYDLQIKFGDDLISSYFGLRKCEYKGMDFLINDEKVFQMLVLDQGFYKDGIYTAKNREEIEADIINSLSLGFNGARLHQRVFENEFLYLADKYGYIVWEEFPSWGVNYSTLSTLEQLKSEWEEVMLQTFNHPSIITWCPLNEVWKDFVEDGTASGALRNVQYIDEIYDFTKSIDSSRPIVPASGGYHGHKNDLNDFHCYVMSTELVKLCQKINEQGVKAIDDINTAPYLKDEKIEHSSLPINLSEFGGMSFSTNYDRKVSWGYNNYSDADCFVNEYLALMEAIKSCPLISGCCYTQLYDVEQEQNGFFTFDRKPKLNDEQMLKIKEINLKLGGKK